MVYAYIQDVPIGEDLYRRIIDQLGPEPVAGQLLHLCLREPEGRLRYIEVWESEEPVHRPLRIESIPLWTPLSAGIDPAPNRRSTAWTSCTPPEPWWNRPGHDPHRRRSAR